MAQKLAGVDFKALDHDVVAIALAQRYRSKATARFMATLKAEDHPYLSEGWVFWIIVRSIIDGMEG